MTTAVSAIREPLEIRPPGAINPRVLLRSIAEHAEWYVPIRSFEGRDHFGHMMIPPDGRIGAVPDELWMFSDREAVECAPQQIGFGTVSGLEVCTNLSPAWRAIQLNPGSADFLTLQLPELVRKQLQQLAWAVPLERELDEVGDAAFLALLPHRLFFVALDRGSPVTVPTVDGSVANGILVFTAADAVDGLLERVPRENVHNLKINSLSGRELFAKLGEVAIDGVLVNPFGPRGRVIIAGEELAELVALARKA